MLVAKNRGWVTEGVEIAPKLAEKCKFETNSKVYAELFEYADLQTHSYDLITFWDLIEHVIDPILILKKAKKLLRAGVLLFFVRQMRIVYLPKLGGFLIKLSIVILRLIFIPKNTLSFFQKKALPSS